MKKIVQYSSKVKQATAVACRGRVAHMRVKVAVRQATMRQATMGMVGSRASVMEEALRAAAQFRVVPVPGDARWGTVGCTDNITFSVRSDGQRSVFRLFNKIGECAAPDLGVKVMAILEAHVR